MSETSYEEIVTQNSGHNNEDNVAIECMDDSHHNERQQQLSQELDDEEVPQEFDCVLDTETDNRVSDEILKYQKEIQKISYLLREKNLVINKLMIALSNQTQEMIHLEKAYHALRQHIIATKSKRL